MPITFELNGDCDEVKYIYSKDCLKIIISTCKVSVKEINLGCIACQEFELVWGIYNKFNDGKSYVDLIKTLKENEKNAKIVYEIADREPITIAGSDAIKFLEDAKKVIDEYKTTTIPTESIVFNPETLPKDIVKRIPMYMYFIINEEKNGSNITMKNTTIDNINDDELKRQYVQLYDCANGLNPPLYKNNDAITVNKTIIENSNNTDSLKMLLNKFLIMKYPELTFNFEKHKEFENKGYKEIFDSYRQSSGNTFFKNGNDISNMSLGKFIDETNINDILEIRGNSNHKIPIDDKLLPYIKNITGFPAKPTTSEEKQTTPTTSSNSFGKIKKRFSNIPRKKKNKKIRKKRRSKINPLASKLFK
jgi:hypothetical protein